MDTIWTPIFRLLLVHNREQAVVHGSVIAQFPSLLMICCRLIQNGRKRMTQSKILLDNVMTLIYLSILDKVSRVKKVIKKQRGPDG